MEYLPVALQVAQKAGQMIKQASDELHLKIIETKENNADLVTKTDKAVEAFVFSELEKSFPGHLFIGEEDMSSHDGRSVGELDDKPTWIIDPIDGTTNFVHGLTVLKEVVLGVVFNPVLGELFYATKGNGAYMLKSNNVMDILSQTPHRLGPTYPTPLPVTLGQALIATEYGASKGHEHLNPKVDLIRNIMTPPISGRGIRSVGSAALSMTLVARGIIDVYYEAGTHAWDVCGGACIVTESGGVCKSWRRGKFDVLDRTVICVRAGVSKEEPTMEGGEEEDSPLLKELISLLPTIPYPRD